VLKFIVVSAGAQRLILEKDFEKDIVSVPREAFEHAGFRRWITSDGFPERVRATFAERELLLDMSPESIDAHNQVKTAVTVTLGQIVRDEDLGQLYADGALVTNEAAGLSTEPDAMFASWQTLETGRLRLLPRSDQDPDGLELVGTLDLVVEVVSPSSVRKDTVVLRSAYARAGISEYWLIDARAEPLRFEILVLDSDGTYAPSAAPGLPQASRLFARSFVLDRRRNRLGRWTYRFDSMLPIRG
jgi:Uma2 family endonuclease